MRYVGVDVGTGNICVTESVDNKVEKFKVKDAFFRMEPDKFLSGSAMMNEKMLKKSGVNYVKVDGVLHVLGDKAFEFANLFHKECLRPMSKGVLNPKEKVSSLMIKELIRGVAGEAQSDDDVLYYCIPANPIDADFDVIYHASVLNDMFVDFGYKNIYKMTEGLAIVYSECEDTSFTGVGISCGAGMVNIAYSFLGVPVLTFSVSKGGDYIDIQSAKARNETANVMQSIKEKGINICDPNGLDEQAISIYYNNLIDYIIEKFKELYLMKDNKDLPNVNQLINIVVAGGTSLAGGFIEKLAEKIDGDFPISVGEVRRAENPLFAVSNGLKNAAQVSNEE